MDVNRWIVTGGRGSGKTTFCQALFRHAHQKGLDAAGIISHARFIEGAKSAIEAEDIRTGEKRPLASTHPQTTTDLPFGDWFFNQQTLDWGNQVIQSSIPCDLLVVDELGPLEFNLLKGWISAFDVLLSARYRLGLIVIRSELLKQAHEKFQPSQIIHMNSIEDPDDKIQNYEEWLDRLIG